MISVFKMSVRYKEVFVSIFLMGCTLALKGQTSAASPTKDQLITNAKLGDVEALEYLLRDHKIGDFDTTEDKAFMSNMLLLKLRSHYVIYGQYFDLLNGEWGGQNPGRVEKVREVALCKKKFDLLAAIPYNFTSYASPVLVDYLVLEQEYAKKMQSLRKTAVEALPNTIAGYVSTPDWIDLNRTESDEEYQRASKNNEIVQEKRLSVLGHFSNLVGNALVAQELNAYYDTAQQQFLADLKKTFPARLAKVYTQEYQRHCNKLYATKQYDTWFEKEYLSISDPYFSSYRFAEYFDNNRPMDGYRLWIDSEYKDRGNMMSQIIYSGRLYALKLALKRGVSPDVLNSKGQSARQVIQRQGYGYIQTQMKKLVAEYDKDPEAFVMEMPERTVYQTLEKKEGEPNFDDPNIPVVGYKIVKLTDGPSVTKDSVTHIRANGRVFLGTFAGNATVFGIDGLENYSIDRRFKHGALLYRIGNDDSWKPLGSRLSLIPQKSGTLQFTVNDRDLKNNSRGFNVEVLGRKRDKRPVLLKDRPKHLRSEKEVLENAKKRADYLRSLSKKYNYKPPEPPKTESHKTSDKAWNIFSDGFVTEVKIKKGQDVHMKCGGSLSLGEKEGRTASHGIPGHETQRVLKDFRLGALCVRIKPDGKWRTFSDRNSLYFISEATGVLEFIINDKNGADNEGYYSVYVKSINRFTHVD